MLSRFSLSGLIAGLPYRRKAGVTVAAWLLGCCGLFLACGGGNRSQQQTGDPAASAQEVLARAPAGELAYLRQYIGKRPAEANLWQTEPLQARLRALLGNDFDTFVDIMQEAGPLTDEQVLYTVGVAPDDAVPGVGYLLVDTGKDWIKAYAVFGDLVIDVQTPGASLAVPAAVEARVKAVMGQ